MFGLLKLCRVVLTGIWSWLSLTLSLSQCLCLCFVEETSCSSVGSSSLLGQAAVSGQLNCIGTVDAILSFDIRQLMVQFSNFDPNVNSVKILTPFILY